MAKQLARPGNQEKTFSCPFLARASVKLHLWSDLHVTSQVGDTTFKYIDKKWSEWPKHLFLVIYIITVLFTLF